ncbi:interferon gamma receptor 1 [Trachinotus anak]|uniref:interferon gamma receptor 1 n=1 Tax=Trachinotus anak TaxID=443729 RepID=UPI0039F1FFA5
MRLHGAFTALLLLVSTLSAVTAAVQKPTNVNLSCQNLKTTVTWDYSEDQPHTSFRVRAKSSAGHYEGETTDHQYDLSPFIWSSLDNYTAFHYVNVTAVQGGRESTPVTSKTLSFNQALPADIKCDLDFPPVSLTAGDSEFTVSFNNPFYFYEELNQATKPDHVYFAFTVSNSSADLGSADCKLGDKICRYDVSFSEGAEECVKLNGRLSDGNHVNLVRFRETDRICASESAEIHMVTLTVLLFVFAFIIIAVAYGIYKMRARMLKLDRSPFVLDFESGQSNVGCIQVSPERCERVALVNQQSFPSCSSGPTEEESRSTEGEDYQSSSAGSDQNAPSNYSDGALLEDSSQEQDPAHGADRTDYKERPRLI